MHKKLFKKVFARSWRTWNKENPRDLWLYISFKSFLCLIISPCHGLKIEKSQLIWNQIPYNWSQNWKFIKEWLRTFSPQKLCWPKTNSHHGPVQRQFARPHNLCSYYDIIVHWWEMVCGENWFFANRNHTRIWRQIKCIY